MSERINRLAKAMSDQGIDAFFACTPVTMGYLHDLWEDGHERLLILAISAKGPVRLICPALTATQAARCGLLDIQAWKDGQDPLELVTDLAAAWNLGSAVIAIDDEMRGDILLGLQNAIPAALFKAGGDVFSAVARVKDGLEIESLKRAADIADSAYEEVRPKIRAGMTEMEISRLLSESMDRLGGKPTFSIVAAGPNGAEPHHLSDSTVLKRGDVVILDFGCEVGHYQSDITRVVAIGEASEKANQVYDIVLRAHHAARECASPGTSSHSVDLAARKVIEDSGYGEFFIHRTGHGIGMRGHESPNINPGNEFLLEAGNCFSIEPGIYLPGEFGVRIENIVMARNEEASFSFNAEPASKLEIVG